MNKFYLLLLPLLIALSSSCAFTDPLVRAQSLSQKGKFEEAIKVLESEQKKQPNSIPIKSILAQTYSDYGLTLCQDTSKPPKVKYTQAKEQFSMALELNPYLSEAKEMHEMIEKIQASFKANKVD